MNTSQRLKDIKRFYSVLENLENNLGGKISLSNCSGRDRWPQRGVYFFFETSQMQVDSGTGLRVTRVGTHALKTGSKSTLWKRLAQHKGTVKNGGGNHRGSIFRLLVGKAILEKKETRCPSWGVGSSAQKEITQKEIAIECMVSEIIRQMPFLYLKIPDEPNPNSLRGYIERNSIALLSNYNRSPVDFPTEDWLGFHCPHSKVGKSGLWNQNHVDEGYAADFIDIFEKLTKGTNF